MNVYEMVTNRIISKLQEGIIPWQRGWTGTVNGAYNYKTKRRYSLLNQLLLSHNDGYLTFKQVQEMGGKVNKGAKSEFVVFWKIMRKEDPNEKDKDGKPVVNTIPILRYYNVFWIGDTTIERKDIEVVEHDPITEAEDIISEYVTRETSLTFTNDRPSNEAYYSPTTDEVVVPMLSQFPVKEEYYSTAFHELTHSTGAAHRLNRLSTGQSAAFGGEDYSKEELVAELGAAMLVNHCGIEIEKTFNNSAGYIQGWLKALNNDQRLIVSAASKAEKAVEFILTGKKGDAA